MIELSNIDAEIQRLESDAMHAVRRHDEKQAHRLRALLSFAYGCRFALQHTNTIRRSNP